MLNRFKSLKNNSGGYILVYVILLMGFITIMFAGTAMALNSRNAVSNKTLSKQQLQVTAQSALKTIVDEFESNAELKSRLKEYAEGNQKANFELTNDTGVNDDIEVQISKESEGKARITVTASNDNNSISTAFAIIDYTVPPKGESAGIIDNLIVAYMPAGMENGGSKTMADGGSDTLLKNSFEGTVIVNNKNGLFRTKGSSYENLIVRGDIESLDFNIKGFKDEDGNPKGALASLDGKVTFANQGQVVGDSFNYIYGGNGIKINRTDNFVWDAANMGFYSGDGGEVYFDSVTGKIGGVYSGGKVTIKAKDNHPLEIHGDVVTTKDIEIGEESPSNQRKATNKIFGKIIGGEDITLRGCLEVDGNISAVANITDNGNVFIKANNILAGRSVDLNGIYELNTNNVLSGANFRKGDNDSKWSDYTKGNSGGKYAKLELSTLENKRTAIANSIVATKEIKDRKVASEAVGKIVDIESTNFDNVFMSLNNTWREDIYRVERGADSKGVINLAVALNSSDLAKGTYSDKFVKERDGNLYFKTNDGYNVSHFDEFTYRKGSYVINNEIKNVYDKVNKAFREAIPLNSNGKDVVPEVIIPTTLCSSYARVEYDGSALYVKGSGYMRVEGNGHNTSKITAVDNNTSEVVTIELNKGADVCFDTISGNHYDVLLGTKPIEELNAGKIESEDITFAWNIAVNQPEENMGYVRFFVPDNAKLTLMSGVVKNTGSNCIPEVYFMTNSNKSITVGHGNGGYYLTGFVIAPHSYINFNRADRDRFNKAFEGLMLCGNVCMPYGDTSARFVYYKPLTYENALTTDVFADVEEEA